MILNERKPISRLKSNPVDNCALWTFCQAQIFIFADILGKIYFNIGIQDALKE
jgi:hypothetical protein